MGFNPAFEGLKLITKSSQTHQITSFIKVLTYTVQARKPLRRLRFRWKGNNRFELKEILKQENDSIQLGPG